MADDFVRHLATVPLFAECSKRDLAKIASLTDEIEVAAGRALVVEGDIGHEAFVVIDGTASVTRDGNEVAEVGPGAVFGEMALIDRTPRNASVTATTPMRVLVIGKREFTGLLDEAADFRTSIMSALAARVRQKDLDLYG
jgi:CRP/FNR family transcriptional regulator, cyclic AMP receptor protein